MEELRGLRDDLKHDMKVSEELIRDHADDDTARNYYQGRVNALKYAYRLCDYRINVLKQREVFRG